MKNIFEKGGEQEPKNLINKDFAISDNNLWFLNKKWDLPEKPEFKIGFAFDDPDQIANCPFFAEICMSAKGPHKYYGFIFGTSKDEKFSNEKLTEWSQKFPESEFFQKISDYGHPAKKL
jgi:hypothetical protein